MTKQGYGGDRLPPAPPVRPSLQTGVTPSQATARPRPRCVDVSYGLWLGACVVGVITVAATLIYFDQLHADVLAIVERQFPTENPATRATVATAAVAILIGTGVVITLSVLAFAIAMYSGRGWTRFVLILFALLGAGYALTVFNAVPSITKVGLLVTVAFMVTAAVPMFLRGTTEWFAHRSLLRSGAGSDVDSGW